MSISAEVLLEEDQTLSQILSELGISEEVFESDQATTSEIPLTVVLTGRTGAGKTNLSKILLKKKPHFVFNPNADTLKPDVVGSTTFEKTTISVADTVGLENAPKKDKEELKRLTRCLKRKKHTVDLLIYCLSVSPGSRFQNDKPVMEALQKAYGKEIWKHCIIVCTFSNWLWSNLETAEKSGSLIDAKKHYQDTLGKYLYEFEKQLKMQGVMGTTVKTVFKWRDELKHNGSYPNEETIIAIPAGLEIADHVLADIPLKFWPNAILPHMIRKCKSNSVQLLKYAYGERRIRKALDKIKRKMLAAFASDNSGEPRKTAGDDTVEDDTAEDDILIKETDSSEL